MERKKFSAELFGKHIEFLYEDHVIGYAILVMRIVMGWIFLQAGIDKLMDPSWTAAGYLQNLPAANPFAGWFAGMAGSGLVDWLVVWGLVLIGLALIFGALMRFAAFWGIVMMLLFWMSAVEGGLLAGFPVGHGWVIDEHIVYAALLFGLAAIGGGRVLGIDGWMHRNGYVERHPWLEYLLG